MSLRVISGTARGRLLKTLPYGDSSVRPMLGRTKKSIFDTIRHKLPESTFVDLFAGVGSVGIEALSCGAKRVVFAELSEISLSLIRYNVRMLGFDEKARIIKCDVVKDFAVLKDKYDIIFMGPPYKDAQKRPLALTYPTLRNIVRYDVLKCNAILIAQKHAKEHVEDVVGLECFRLKKYGDTVVSFYRKSKI